LLAVDTRYTAGDRVRHLPWHTLVALDCLLLAHGDAHRVAHSLGALLRNHAANLVAAGLGLGDHAADLVAASLGALLRNHAANLVAAGLGLGDHAADLVAASLGALLRNHTANFVAAGLGLRDHTANFVAASLLLRHHVANLVAAGTRVLLGHHVANLVATSLLLRHHPANLVTAGTCAWFAHVLRAADFLRVALRNPNTLAAGTGWALAANFAARAGAVDALAMASIPFPATGLTYALAVSTARNLITLLFPVTTIDLDSLGIRHSLANVVSHVAAASFPNRLANGVASLLGFPDCFASRVGHFAGASFPDRLVDCVAALTGFPDRLADCVSPLLSFPNGAMYRIANVACLGFPNGPADCVGPLLGFPNGVVHRVANVACLGFPDRLADRVSACLGFPDRLANRVANLLLALLTDITSHVDNSVFANAVVNSAAALDALTLPFYTPYRLHHGVALLLVATRSTAVVPCGSAISGPCYRRQHC